MLAFNCVRGTGPVYFNDVCTPLADIPRRSSLQAADCGNPLVTKTIICIESKFSDRSAYCMELTSSSSAFFTSVFPYLPPSKHLLHSKPTTCKLVPANPLCIHYMIDDLLHENLRITFKLIFLKETHSASYV